MFCRVLLVVVGVAAAISFLYYAVGSDEGYFADKSVSAHRTPSLLVVAVFAPRNRIQFLRRGIVVRPGGVRDIFHLLMCSFLHGLNVMLLRWCCDATFWCCSSLIVGFCGARGIFISAPLISGFLFGSCDSTSASPGYSKRSCVSSQLFFSV